MKELFGREISIQIDHNQDLALIDINYNSASISFTIGKLSAINRELNEIIKQFNKYIKKDGKTTGATVGK